MTAPRARKVAASTESRLDSRYSCCSRSQEVILQSLSENRISRNAYRTRDTLVPPKFPPADRPCRLPLDIAPRARTPSSKPFWYASSSLSFIFSITLAPTLLLGPNSVKRSAQIYSFLSAESRLAERISSLIAHPPFPAFTICCTRWGVMSRSRVSLPALCRPSWR